MEDRRRRASLPLLLLLFSLLSSFDHMLGWIKCLNPEINGIMGAEWNPVSASDPASEKVYFHDDLWIERHVAPPAADEQVRAAGAVDVGGDDGECDERVPARNGGRVLGTGRGVCGV
ncbi:non-specific phospholipase C2 [Canna indica]|uniref:Non-specific phospholipase C2 n=1 Tax=Canna indica TaxID=4628 RepID=A0AAQ3PZ99_9LILI|nr:non-specific phospholipase C2 [Canna indica]